MPTKRERSQADRKAVTLRRDTSWSLRHLSSSEQLFHALQRAVSAHPTTPATRSGSFRKQGTLGSTLTSQLSGTPLEKLHPMSETLVKAVAGPYDGAPSKALGKKPRQHQDD